MSMRTMDIIAGTVTASAFAFAAYVVFFEIVIGPERINMATILWSCVTRIG